MRAVFFGTPDWAVPSLDALAGSEWEVAAVVANPDRPAGRGYDLQAPPVKTRALELGLEVRQPERAKDPELAEWLQGVAPDVCVVVAYGKILPGALLAVPRLGFVNLHFSLLPLYRGAAPVQRAIMEGRSETGVSTMVLTEGMDEGPVLGRVKVPVREGETAGELGSRLAVIGAELLVGSLRDFAAGRLEPVPQDDSLASYAPKITSEEARIDWNEDAAAITAKVHGLNPAPGAWTTWREGRFKVHGAEALPGAELEPGEPSTVGGELRIGTGRGTLLVHRAQPPGKRAMSGADVARGLKAAPGERFR